MPHPKKAKKVYLSLDLWVAAVRARQELLGHLYPIAARTRKVHGSESSVTFEDRARWACESPSTPESVKQALAAWDRARNAAWEQAYLAKFPEHVFRLWQSSRRPESFDREELVAETAGNGIPTMLRLYRGPLERLSPEAAQLALDYWAALNCMALLDMRHGQLFSPLELPTTWHMRPSASTRAALKERLGSHGETCSLSAETEDEIVGRLDSSRHEDFHNPNEEDA